MDTEKRCLEGDELADDHTDKKIKLEPGNPEDKDVATICANHQTTDPQSNKNFKLESESSADLKTGLNSSDQLTNVDQKVRRRKVVLLLSYSGWGYLGMQRNPGAKTIEGDLLLALKNAGFISEDEHDKPQLMLFQRAARTDKGVSAVRQVVSLKLREDADVEILNQHLPSQIRVICKKRTTKGFNSKVNCDARTYSYVLPTYAFSPFDVEPNDAFRISEDTVQTINEVLQNYKGTHNFHNFTQKKTFKDASAKRFMHSFSCGAPFVRDGREYIVLTVKGQSFMQHHIRKMIGLAIAIVRGFTSVETILRAFTKDCLDIPKAPGLGLMLEEVHYEGYNKRYGNDGVHEKLDWSEHDQLISDFKEKYILQKIFEAEGQEKSMLTWLETLSGHSYSLREERPPTIGLDKNSASIDGLSKANQVKKLSTEGDEDEPPAIESSLQECKNGVETQCELILS